MTRRTVIVVMANGCGWNAPLGVAMTPRAADKLIKDIQEFLAKAPVVDFNAADRQVQEERWRRYLGRRSWGVTAWAGWVNNGAGCFSKVRVPVGWGT